MNFDYLKLRKLMATHYEAHKQSYYLTMYRDDSGTHTEIKTLSQNGDFRSPECIELLKEADIICTNPPFSLFREYVSQLMTYNKKFLILGNMNAITYKEIFPLIRDNKIWTGYKHFGGGMDMIVPNDLFDNDKVKKYRIDDNGNIIVNIMGVIWYTNLDIKKRHEDLLLYREYSSSEYPTYDNYNAIEVGKVADIPADYFGNIGVPITFIDNYNPEQFEIIGSFNASSLEDKEKEGYVLSKDTPIIADGIEKLWNGPVINKKPLYKRIVIRRIQNDNKA